MIGRHWEKKVAEGLVSAFGPEQLRPTDVESKLAGSLVLNRVKRQLQFILPQDKTLTDLDGEGLDRLGRCVRAMGEQSLFRIAKLFAKQDENKDGVLDQWEFQKMMVELSSYIPGAVVQFAHFMPDRNKPLPFLEFADVFAGVYGKGAVSGASGSSNSALATQPRSRTAFTSETIMDEALSLLGTYGRTDGTMGLLEFKRMLASLDETHGWEHSILAVLSLFKRADVQRAGVLDLQAVMSLLRDLHRSAVLGTTAGAGMGAVMGEGGPSSEPSRTASSAAVSRQQRSGSELSSMASRDELFFLPKEELKLIFETFISFDREMEGLLDEVSFVRLWPALRARAREGVHSVNGRNHRFPIACILLPVVPAQSPDELKSLFRLADETEGVGGNTAGVGKLDVNEVVCAMIDAAEKVFATKALSVVQETQVQPALKEAHLRPELREAMPVALRLLRGLDPEGDATLNENEFVRGFRFLIEAASKLGPPLLTNMPVERRKLKSLFQTADLNHDGKLDANEWLLLLQLQQGMLPALIRWSNVPYRNELVKQLRLAMKKSAERRQRDRFRG
ncbi:hypothetical protein Ctob_006497 [Chrysochromulina tobinii]|uniref:EF-hand domain-containing protein n=1 Tax=Chrysochromulina tobinii TaxID=1460289 RepID=A0A0M0JJ22_9EUKA|nr:hypothetical protein Ctob_006497 [Chrysochromulina tobinii]|eukprot:KOO26243.1 hypothetical protein Ctob_006497 [Chrysochromulina sp. CCMP291]